MDDEDSECWQTDDENDRSAGWTNKERSLFDVEDYLSGILWNLQVMVLGWDVFLFCLFNQPQSPATCLLL